MKRLAVLGSTGSIGRKALSIAARFRDRFAVTALSAKSNIALLAEQVREFGPEAVAVFDEAGARQLKELLPGDRRTRIMHGESGLCAVAAWESAELTLTAVVGAAGLLPTLAAINAGKAIALANKETLVMAGELVTGRAREKGVAIIPVDSEHSAIFQCLQGQRRQDVDHLLLTASGGPFLNRPKDRFATITRDEALKHPNWSMGAKITIDSATLMNKGLEVLEAKSLFGVSHDMIRVVVHPQSVIHSMVAFRDGTVMAQLGIPDMGAAIAYGLSFPDRLPLNQPLPDFSGATDLTFQAPDLDKFPCLGLAIEACRRGGTMPAVLNAANEVAVNGFLEGRIGFDSIAAVVAETMQAHDALGRPGLEDVLAADRWARDRARSRVEAAGRTV
jgi:1-deoxy-D-xylulose-5-phosphate reductoisomerase